MLYSLCFIANTNYGNDYPSTAAQNSHRNTNLDNNLDSSSNTYGFSRGSYQVQYDVLCPIDFGADPTGFSDSSDAFNATIFAALSRGVSTTSSGRNIMGADTVDLGGVTIDLAGGRYAISTTIIFPAGFSY